VFRSNFTEGGTPAGAVPYSNGGGISAGDVRVFDTTFDSNYTTGDDASGGAISGKNVYVNGSTFSGNSVADDEGTGGAITSSNGSVEVIHSTLTNNYAGYRGGAIYGTTSSVNLTNSIVSGNLAEDDGNDIFADDLDFFGNNAVQSFTATTASGPRIIATPSQLFNPAGGGYGPLLDNNGAGAGAGFSEIVKTIELKAVANPAIDATTATVNDKDARGLYRGVNDPINSNGGLADLGAIEQQEIDRLRVFNNGLSGIGSLPDAIDFANQSSDFSQITFAPQMSGQVIQLNGSESTLEIDHGTVIDASELLEPLTIRGTGSSEIIEATGNVPLLILDNLELTNGRDNSVGSFAGGGAIEFGVNVGQLILKNSKVFGNSSIGPGGAIRAEDGVVSLLNSQLFGNFTDGDGADGGGIYANQVYVANGSRVFNNETRSTSGAEGGGIFAKLTASISGGSSVYGNSTVGSFAEGGGIYANVVNVSDSSVTGNSTSGNSSEGGGIFAADTVSLVNSVVSDNRTSGDNSEGGGIYARDVGVLATNSLISNNLTTGDSAGGGGIYSKAFVSLSNTTVAGNRTGGPYSDGGGIYTTGSSDVIITSSTITGNATSQSSSYGGGISEQGLGELQIHNSLVIGNYSGDGTFHEIAGGYSQTGNNLIGGPDNNTGIQASDVFETTSVVPKQGSGGTESNSQNRLGGVLSDNGGPVQTVALKPTAFNPAIDGSVAPETLLSFEGNADDGFGNNDGVLQGGLTATADGIRGNAIEFNGDSNEFVQMSNPLTIGDKSHTVEIWVKVPEVGSNGLVAGERVGEMLGSFSSGPNANWGILADGQIQIFWNNGQVRLRGNQDLRDNQWHHLTFVRDTVANEFRAYIDGIEEALDGAGGNTNVAGSDLTFTTPHRIGKDNRSSTPVPFHGVIDELEIHERALTPAEIAVRANRVDARGFERVAAPDSTSAGQPPLMDLGAIETPSLEKLSLVVTTTFDVSDETDGVTSLREAIEFANSGDADGDGFANDVITFDPSLQGETVTLDGTALSVTESAEIIGAETTLDADDQSRVLIFDSAVGDLRLEGLHLTKGLVVGGDGGAIDFRSTGTLTLDSSRVSLSRSIESDTTRSKAAGIKSDGDVVLNESLIDGNAVLSDVGLGGGVFAAGTITANNSTIFNNFIWGDFGDGGGLAASTVNLNNSTIVANGVPLFSGDGGGFVATTSTINNSIILGNRAPSNDEFRSLTSVMGGMNLIGEDSTDFDASSESNADNANLDFVFNSVSLDLDAFLPTLELKRSVFNPALDAGDDSLVVGSTDVRGEARIADLVRINNGAGSVDIGAYELQTDETEINNFVVTSLGDNVDPLDYQITLREAVELANATPGVQEISFGELEFVNPQTITLGSQLNLTEPVSILGPGAEILTVSGGGSTRVFNVSNVSGSVDPFVVTDFAIEDGEAGTGSGGGILVSNADFRAARMRFSNNAANGGGAISATNTFYDIYNSSFVGNIANFSGSAIHSLGSSNGFIGNSTFAGNVSVAGSGVILGQAGNGESGQVILRNSTIAENTGVGLQMFSFAGGSGTMNVGNTILSGNTGSNLVAGGDGDEIFLSVGHNISDDGTGNFGSSDMTNRDPLLQALDATAPLPYFGLQPTSPAVDAGDDSLATDRFGTPMLLNEQGDGVVDQRGEGFNRFFDGNNDGTITVDIGSIEVSQSQAVVGRGIFYNDSRYDNNDATANSGDDGAVSNKVALLPGQAASAANYTNYVKGINGIFIDIANLDANVTPTAGDFQFRIGNEDNTANWTALGTQPDVSIRRGEGIGGSDRITLTWAPDANGDPIISDTWLQVIVLEAGSNNLGVSDEFYFGNLIGEVTGPGGNGSAVVNSSDFGAVSANFSAFGSPILGVDDVNDISKDGRVTSTDAGAVSANFTQFGSPGLRMIAPFVGAGRASLTGGAGSPGESDDREGTSEKDRNSNPSQSSRVSRFEEPVSGFDFRKSASMPPRMTSSQSESRTAENFSAAKPTLVLASDDLSRAGKVCLQSDAGKGPVEDNEKRSEFMLQDFSELDDAFLDFDFSIDSKLSKAHVR
jgi:hypothetical protein